MIIYKNTKQYHKSFLSNGHRPSIRGLGLWLLDRRPLLLGPMSPIPKTCTKICCEVSSINIFIMAMIIIIIIIIIPTGIKVNNKNSRRRCDLFKATIKTPKQRHWRFSKICIVNFEQISHPVLVFLLLNLNRQMSTGITSIPIFPWENFIFCRISTELLMENRTKVIDDYLSNLKVTVSKAGLKMLCHVVLTSTIHCMTKIISIHCDMPDDLRGLFDLRDLWGFSFPYIFVTFSFMPPAKSNLSSIYYQKYMH